MKKIRTITKIGGLKRNLKSSAARPQPPHSSGTVLNHSYSPETGHLTVTFHGGRQYRYEGVGEGVAAGLAEAESKGSYLHKHIIGNFDTTKI